MGSTKNKDITEAVENGKEITVQDIEQGETIDLELSEIEQQLEELKPLIKNIIQKHYKEHKKYKDLVTDVLKGFEFGRFSLFPTKLTKIYTQREMNTEGVLQLHIHCVLIRIDGYSEEIALSNEELVNTKKFVDLMSLYPGCIIQPKGAESSRINLKNIYDNIELEGLTNVEHMYWKKGFIPGNNDIVRLDNVTINTASGEITECKNHFYESPQFILNYYPSDCTSITEATAKLNNAMDTWFENKTIGYIYGAYLKMIPFKKDRFKHTKEMYMLGILGQMNTFKTTTMRVGGNIIGYDNTVVFSCSNQTPYPVLSHLGTFDLAIFVDEISRIAKIKGFVQDILIANYNQKEVKRGDRSRRALSKNVCFTNSSMLILGGQGLKFDEATLSRTIQLIFQREGTVNMLNKEQMNEVVIQGRHGRMYILQNKREINFLTLYQTAEELVTQIYEGVDKRLLGKLIFVTCGIILGQEITDEIADKVLVACEYIIKSHNESIQNASTPINIIDDITNNIDQYCSIHKYVKEDSLPSLYIQEGKLYVAPKLVVKKYTRRFPHDNSNNDLTHELSELLGVGVSEDNVTMFNSSRRQKRKYVEVNAKSPEAVKRLYNTIIEMANSNKSFFEGVNENNSFHKKYMSIRPAINTIAGFTKV